MPPTKLNIFVDDEESNFFSNLKSPSPFTGEGLGRGCTQSVSCG